MIKGWKKSTLGEACAIEKGKASAANEPPGSYPLITTGAERKSSANWQFEGPAVCIPMISAYGHGKPGLKHVHYQEGKFALANILSALLIKNPNELSAKFLSTFLNFYKDHLIVPLQFGAANMSITIERLATVPIWYPSLTEQERILCLLEEVRSLRKLRGQASARMEKFVPALFHEMFGDSNKMTQLGNLVEEFRYGTSNKADPRGFPTLRIPNVIGQRIDLDDLKFVTVSSEEFKRIRMIDGDILFVRSNGNPDNIGRSAIFESELITQAGLDPEKFIYASYLIRARLKNEIINPHFLQLYLSTPDGRMEVKKRARTSAGQYNINTENLSTIPIPIPPLTLQHEFARQVQEAHGVQSVQARSEARIEALYQSMLSRAFAGEL